MEVRKNEMQTTYAAYCPSIKLIIDNSRAEETRRQSQQQLREPVRLSELFAAHGQLLELREDERPKRTFLESSQMLFHSMKKLGLSDVGATRATEGRNPQPLHEAVTESKGADPSQSRIFDALRAIGLNESTARIAARGRV
jgi:hypothetical protein